VGAPSASSYRPQDQRVVKSTGALTGASEAWPFLIIYFLTTPSILRNIVDKGQKGNHHGQRTMPGQSNAVEMSDLCGPRQVIL
jgi:hypothetical protein